MSRKRKKLSDRLAEVLEDRTGYVPRGNASVYRLPHWTDHIRWEWWGKNSAGLECRFYSWSTMSDCMKAGVCPIDTDRGAHDTTCLDICVDADVWEGT